jgi:hypothetical protein
MGTIVSVVLKHMEIMVFESKSHGDKFLRL